MKTKIKRHSRSVISVLLAVCMLISCMTAAMIATDAAKTEGETVGANADSEAVGYTSCKVKGTWDSWTLHDITTSAYSVDLAANSTYSFVYVAENGDQFSSSATISGTTDYNFSRNNTDAIKLKTTIAGSYKFIFKSWGSSGDSITVRIEFPANTETTTWTAVGAYGTGSTADAGFFGTAWAPTATANDMTQSDTTWSKTWNNVTLSSAQTVYYKVAKNHGWDTAYPAQNATQQLSAGTYNITITYDSSDNSVALTATSVAKSTLTVASVGNAVVKATYNGTTAGEGQSIQDVPQDATVSVTVIPDSGKQCTAVTGTYNTNSTVAGTGAGQSWSLVMPGADTTVSVTLGNVTMKKIYFNNSYTLYGSVYAYVYDKDSSDNHTYEYLGPRPGTTMTKLDNSNIWYIEVPSDVDYVEFISGEGKTTGEMSIPWTSHTYPKYTAPYNYNAPTIANGGTWGNYIYGSDNKRTNECTVSNGNTMSASNLFTGITATMYDYYTDNEVDNGWLNIASNEYSQGSNGNGWKWNPYTKLNSSLSAYANNTAQPNYDVTYPLYFGNLNTWSDNGNGNAIGSAGLSDRATVVGYYNWNLDANNSIQLDDDNNAVTGLSGKTLANDTIHYYKSGDTNENGAPMAMFDEDFLSGENTQNKALATILRTSSFPVRKTTEGATVSSITELHLDPTGDWANGNAVFDAYFWGSSLSGTWKQFTGSGTDYVADIPSGAQNVIITRNSTHVTSFTAWNQSEDISLTLSGSSATNKVKFTGWNNEKGTFSTSLDTSLSGCTTTGGHDYYEYDSTGGKDNAYITNLSNDKKTAKIDYYANDAAWSGGTANNTQGFFPFDYANKGSLAKDLGFGMKLTIPFTLNGNGTDNGVNTDGTDQEFRFSGDDDLWVFVDGKLVLDLGGAHARTEGSINFHDKTVTATNQQAIGSATRNGSFASGFNTNENYVHTMTIYYMERGMFESNLKFGFSFHAIPNQFWIDKKIRTKDIINAGFYTPNNQTGVASNQDDTLTQQEGRFISKFEASYQNESFTVTHKYGETAAGATTAASGKKYTIDNDTNTYTTPSDGTYPIKHDLGNAFIGQFTTGHYFNLKEDYGNSNKYVYTPAFSVWDQANNNQAITATGDNSSGYTFQFNPTTTVTTGIENTNIKARFENFMDAHTLTLTKELTNTVDPNAAFTLQVLFDFENDGNYIAYPLYCDLDGVRTQLNNNGTIDIRAGQILEIEEIPQNAKIKVQELLTDTVSGYRYDSISLTQAGASINPASTFDKGVVFTMHGADIVATVKNKKPENKYTIVYKYPSYGASPKTDSLYGEQSYTVTGVFTKSELESYMTLSNGALAFQNANTEKTFISNKAPYEDNFMQNLSFSNATLTKTGTGWDANGDYYCEATTTSTADYTINAYFKLPYAVDSDLIPQESSNNSGKVLYSSNTTTCGIKDITCFDWYVTSGKSHVGDTSTEASAVYVNAPLILYTNVDNEDSKLYFQYWSVKSQSAYGKQSTEYTRCYDYEFNFALFMDSIIEPVYSSSWAQPTATGPKNYKDYERYNPEIQIQGNDIGINIAFLENSRNQYNNDGGGTRTGAAADVIYSDFLLNFNYNASDGLVQLNQLGANKKKAGLVIEAVALMDYEVENGQPTTNFDFDKNYSEVESFTANAETKAAEITTWLQGGSQPARCVKSQFDVTALDNKNCKQYYYSLNNRKLSDGQLLNTSQNRYQVFRAYAYIGNVDGNKLSEVQLSAPVYFTIYDVGSQRLPDNVTN